MERNRKVNLESVVVQSREILATDIDDEVVMMSIERGTYSGLDAVGSEIWKLLETPRRVSEICNIMMGRFDVERTQCEEDVLAYLNDLASDDTIQMVDAVG